MLRDLKFDFDDITIVPAELSYINSRSECNVFNQEGKLPLMTSPMYSVVSENTANSYHSLNINVVLPRVTKPLDQRDNTNNPIHSLSLQEFKDLYLSGDTSLIDKGYNKILIDVANGHMKSLIDAVDQARDIYGDKIYLVVGNIANPKTIDYLVNADAVRVGIGAGSVCTTSANTSIHYPMASLISECYERSFANSVDGKRVKIIADGGFNNFDTIIKALVLGADYVMLGSLFAKALGSAGEYSFNQFNDHYITSRHINTDLVDINNPDVKSEMYNAFIGKNLTKKYYGMSTKYAQTLMGKEDLRTSEGVIREINIEYTLEGWVDNFISYLKSCMSYTNSRNLAELKDTQYVFITEAANRRFKK